MSETPMQGLAEYWRAVAAHFTAFTQPEIDSAATIRRWASEVEAARASLPAPTDADWMKEAERLANRLVNRAAMESSYSGGPLASKYRGERQAAQSLLMLHLRARPAEPTPSVDVLRQCLTALKELANTFHQGRAIALSPNSEGYVASALSAAESAIDAARQALEKP